MAALSDITPFILTYNEEPNLARCLESVAWASQILVLDSCSTDGTAAIVARYPQARFVQRPFDSHSAQANFGLGLVESSWVLSLDADYVLSPELQAALSNGEIPFDADTVYFAPFKFRVYGKLLRSCFMPPRGILYARAGAVYDQDGHTQRLSIAGRRTVLLRHPIIHDDRKALPRWLESQRKYAALEADKLEAAPWEELNLPDRLRATGWAAPIVIFPYALFVRGLIFDGLPGILYAVERLYAEVILALYVLHGKLAKTKFPNDQISS
jgi:glycosyltransferase involved in cell wall biosynthesis